MNDTAPEKIVTLDVRAGLAAGIDPFEEIMAARKRLAADETLQIINTFEPIPLINKLRAMGYASWTERPEPGVIYTFFRQEAEAVTEAVEEVPATEGTDFEQKLVDFCNRIRKIDVRHLEMPEPMVTILKELETLADDHALFVEHNKTPQFLLPELKQRDYTVLFNELGPGQLQLLIFRETREA